MTRRLEDILGPPRLPPDEIFLKLASVTVRTTLSKSEIYRRIREGTFPPSRKFQSGAVGEKGAFWLASEKARWQQQEVDQAPQVW